MQGQMSRLAAEGGVVVSHATRAKWIARILGAIASLALPVLASVATLVVAWELRATPLTLLDGVLSPPDQPELYPSTWLSVGHAVVPVVFFISNLVNRRYGEHFAIAHVLASWTCAALLALAMLYRVDPALPQAGDAAVGVRIAGAFLGAMMIGQLAGVFVFDRTRGVVWWNAPLYGALAGSFVSLILYYVIAFTGSDPIWINHLSVDAGVKAAMAFALLVPYLILRPLVRPLGGLGGY
jgi:queuosine precursor transporter